ncbi:MAG: hypothetical protein M1824_001566 [Vezdaea acicularis]|nr:MAG: hypothetical protein M1824_001566 [Vezdaea acicularis]
MDRELISLDISIAEYAAIAAASAATSLGSPRRSKRITKEPTRFFTDNAPRPILAKKRALAAKNPLKPPLTLKRARISRQADALSEGGADESVIESTLVRATKKAKNTLTINELPTLVEGQRNATNESYTGESDKDEGESDGYLSKYPKSAASDAQTCEPIENTSAALGNEARTSLTKSDLPFDTEDSSFELAENVASGMVLPAPRQRRFGESDKRPQPHGAPLVWADGRQALCETLPYYNSYQRSNYTSDLLSRGFLVDKMASQYDWLDEDILITRAGGGLKLQDDGTYVQTHDQKSDSRTVFDFKRNMDKEIPVVVIVGSKNPCLQVATPHPYCILDFFMPTHVWCQRQSEKSMYMYRFERMNIKDRSWWAVKGADPPPRSFSRRTVRKSCEKCRVVQPQVYAEGWMCLDEKCSAFWKINGFEPLGELHYAQAFIEERTKWSQEHTENLRPAQAPFDDEKEVGYSVSSRAKWSVKQSVLSPEAASNPQPLYTIREDSGILKTQAHFMNYIVHIFTIPDCGTVIHFAANATVNERSGGPNDMFKDLQENGVGLKRFQGATHKLVGGMLSQFYSLNFGMPYKYAVATASKSFHDAPDTIMRALHRLSWAGKQAVDLKPTCEIFREFNELLILGYMEKDKIAYHDDGEKELGSTIASLSLGSEATMYFRMKPKSFTGFNPSYSIYKPEWPLVTGCHNHAARSDLNARWSELSQAERKVAVEALPRPGKRRRAAGPVVLQMRLCHGDIMVMHGAGIQKHYEHAVAHSDKLRFALTCRHVLPAMVPENVHWMGDFTKRDELDYDGDQTPAAGATDGLQTL